MATQKRARPSGGSPRTKVRAGSLAKARARVAAGTGKGAMLKRLTTGGGRGAKRSGAGAQVGDSSRGKSVRNPRVVAAQKRVGSTPRIQQKKRRTPSTAPYKRAR